MTNLSVRVERNREPKAAVSGVTPRPKFFSKIHDNISSWVKRWRRRIGASRTQKPVQEDERRPRVSVIEELPEAQPKRKLERRKVPSCGPRRRRLDNELEGERRRPKSKPKKKKWWVIFHLLRH